MQRWEEDETLMNFALFERGRTFYMTQFEFYETKKKNKKLFHNQFWYEKKKEKFN